VDSQCETFCNVAIVTLKKYVCLKAFEIHHVLLSVMWFWYFDVFDWLPKDDNCTPKENQRKTIVA
jgi:hypothetical protein